MTYALAALPLNLLMGYAGQISLGHAAFLGIGAYSSGIIAGRLGLPFALGLLVATAVGALAALVIGLPALRIRGLYLALVTLGFGLAMSSMVFRLRAVTGGYAGQAVPRPQAGTYVFLRNADLLSIIVVIFGLVWALDRNLLRTKVGRGFLALREDEEVAAAFGVDVPAYKLYAFALYGALSAIAGSVFGHVVGFAQQESFAFDLSLLFVVIVLIGGLRSRPGVAAAAFFFGVTPRFFSFLQGWELVIAPAFVLFTLVRHPGGLGQTFDDGAAAHPRRPPPPAVVPTDDETGHPTAPRRSRPAFAARGPMTSAKANVRRARSREVRLSVRFGGLVAVDDVSLDGGGGRHHRASSARTGRARARSSTPSPGSCRPESRDRGPARRRRQRPASPSPGPRSVSAAPSSRSAW